MKLGDYIKSKNMTLEEFGDLIGMSRSATHGIARELADPTPRTARAIVAATKGKVTLKDLYGES